MRIKAVNRIMALSVAVRLIFLIFVIAMVSSMSNININVGCDHTIRRYRRSLPKALISSARRFYRAIRARKVMLADATLVMKDENVVVYWKSGGRIRAERDFWMIDVFDVKKGFDTKESSAWKCGIVGDSTVEFVNKFSDYSPMPAIYLFKEKQGVRSVTVVLYR